MKTQKYFFLACLALILSCHNDVTIPPSSSVPFTEIAKGDLYGNGGEGILQSNKVINDQSDWEDLMNQMNSVNNVTNGFTETEIDFSSEQIIAVFHEIKPSSGWSIEITEIIENGTNRSVSLHRPSNNATAAAVMTQPYHIVKTPISELPIIFE